MDRRFLTRVVLPALLVGLVASACTDTPEQASLEVPTATSHSSVEATTAQSKPLPTTTTTPAPPLSFPAPKRIFSLPTWQDDPEGFFSTTVNVVLSTAQKRDPQLGTAVPVARMITVSRDIPCEGRGTHVDGNNPAAPAIWCDTSNGQKFYIGEATLRDRATHSSMHVSMLVLHAVGEYVLDKYDYAYTPAATACASGYITQLLAAADLVSDEVAVNEMAYAIPDTNFVNSFQDGFRNSIGACRL